MAKWAVGLGAVLVLIGGLLWQLSRSPTKPAVIPSAPATPAKADEGPSKDDEPARSRTPGPRTSVASATPSKQPKAGQLDPTSTEFSGRIDTVIPAKLRAVVARCYDGQGDGNRSVHISYRLRVHDGMVSALNARATKSEVGSELEHCIIGAVEEARWRDDLLPDFEEDEELFVRLRTLKKYKDRDENDE